MRPSPWTRMSCCSRLWPCRCTWTTPSLQLLQPRHQGPAPLRWRCPQVGTQVHGCKWLSDCWVYRVALPLSSSHATRAQSSYARGASKWAWLHMPSCNACCSRSSLQFKCVPSCWLRPCITSCTAVWSRQAAAACLAFDKIKSHTTAGHHPLISCRPA